MKEAKLAINIISELLTFNFTFVKDELIINSFSGLTYNNSVKLCITDLEINLIQISKVKNINTQILYFQQILDKIIEIEPTNINLEEFPYEFEKIDFGNEEAVMFHPEENYLLHSNYQLYLTLKNKVMEIFFSILYKSGFDIKDNKIINTLDHSNNTEQVNNKSTKPNSYPLKISEVILGENPEFIDKLCFRLITEKYITDFDSNNLKELLIGNTPIKKIDWLKNRGALCTFIYLLKNKSISVNTPQWKVLSTIFLVQGMAMQLEESYSSKLKGNPLEEFINESFIQ